MLAIATVSFRIPAIRIGGSEALAQAGSPTASAGRPLRVLFLGSDQPAAAGQTPTHQASGFYQAVGTTLGRKGIQLTPVLSPAALTPDRLNYYDAILIYGSHASMAPEQEKALVDFVESGKGLVALHSASDSFAGSERYTMLIGAHSRAAGHWRRRDCRNRAVVASRQCRESSHLRPGTRPSPSPKQNTTDRTVLMERVDGTGRTPWTWVRNQGKGRVFYSAYGHDQRTWNNDSFKTLVERAIVWSVPEPARVGAPAAGDPAGELRRRDERSELRESRPGTQISAAVRGRRGDEVHSGPCRVLAQSLRRRTRHRQADRVRVRRARSDVDCRNGGLSERSR